MRKQLRTVLKFLVIAVAGGAVAGALAGWVVAQFLHVPQVDLLAEFEPAATTHIYAADGEQVASPPGDVG